MTKPLLEGIEGRRVKKEGRGKQVGELKKHLKETEESKERKNHMEFSLESCTKSFI